MLRDIAEFVKRLEELATTAPLDTLAVVVAGSAGIGFLGKAAWDRLTRRNGEAPPLPANGCYMPQHADLAADLARLQEECARLSRSLSEATARSVDCEAEQARLNADLKMAQDTIALMLADEGEVWRVHPPRANYVSALNASRAKIVMVANNKGGVGKTTLTVYLAAYFRAKGKRVLVIDLDFQGSCTLFMLRAGDVNIPGNQPHRLAVANTLLSEGPLTSWPAEVLSGDLSGVQLITSTYSLTQHERQQMGRWLAQGGQPDARYFLSDVLMSPYVQDPVSGFDVVLIDAPPRLTTGAINALIASTHLLVPTKLDLLSAETVGSFLRQVWALRSHMNLGIELTGVVGTMTPAQPLGAELRPIQQDALAVVRAGLAEWKGNTYIFDRDIQEVAAISSAAGRSISSDSRVVEMFSALGNELLPRIGMT
jgi:cellulose biosynthesis protein BcsQ